MNIEISKQQAEFALDAIMQVGVNTNIKSLEEGVKVDEYISDLIRKLRNVTTAE